MNELVNGRTFKYFHFSIEVVRVFVIDGAAHTLCSRSGDHGRCVLYEVGHLHVVQLLWLSVTNQIRSLADIILSCSNLD